MGEQIKVDSHHHFWELGRLEYPWMPLGDPILTRNYLPEDLAPILKQNQVSKTVLVQATHSLEEANFLLDLAESTDFVAGVVAWVDLADPNVGNVLDELQRRSGMVGVRHQVHDEPDDSWLVRKEVVRGLRELTRRDLAYDLLLRPQHIKYVLGLVDQVPHLRMVVDHIAKPLISQKIMEPWASDISALSDLPGIYCKISGMVTEANHSEWNVDDIRPYAAHVVEQFGYDRIMWGSDWPVCLLAAEYGQVMHSSTEAVGPMSDDQMAKFIGANAIQFYKL